MPNSKSLDTYKCFIDNEWIEGEHGKWIEVENPANGQVYARVPYCSENDANKAIESSAKAQKEWQALTAIERAGHLYAISNKLKEERDHFARLLVAEQGKTLEEAGFEVDDTIRYMTYSAEAARRIKGDIFPADAPDEQLFIFKVPFGVTIGLCAYNYPLALIGRKVGPALVTGNTMVIKPHEATPTTASEFCRLVKEAGVPKGVVNMVTGGADVGQALVEHPLTRLVSLTGSIRAGQAVAKSASKNMAALSLELGGKAPFIVLESADIDEAVEAAAIARFANCGQVCICNELVLVQDSIADEFTEKLINRIKEISPGDPAKNAGMGPVTTAGALDRIDGLVQSSIKQGAKVVMGAKRPDMGELNGGNWYSPTVLTDVTTDMPIVEEETFGPVLPIMRVSGYEEALEIANARPDGLSAYLWCRDPSIYMHAIHNMETGTIFLNKGIVGYIQGYHNGHKLSGHGGEDGIYGIEGFLQKRTVYMKY